MPGLRNLAHAHNSDTPSSLAHSREAVPGRRIHSHGLQCSRDCACRGGSDREGGWRGPCQQEAADGFAGMYERGWFMRVFMEQFP